MGNDPPVDDTVPGGSRPPTGAGGPGAIARAPPAWSNAAMRTLSSLVIAAAVAAVTLACGSSSADAPRAPAKAAAVGKPAPDFKLADLAGKPVSLASFKGKVVVLEWFTPGCPFVKKSHGPGLARRAGETATPGPAWWCFQIKSGAPGKAGRPTGQ